MSLVRIGLRMAAVEALRGRTLVGESVLDSEIGAISVRPDGTLGSDVENRFIAVYTQSSQVSSLTHGPRGIYEGGTVELIFEAGITAAMLMDSDDGGKREMFEGVPVTDADFEFYLDLLGRQIVDCLLDPDNEWAEIWRGFVLEINKFELLRTDNAQHIRLAGHQLKMTCTVVDDPLPGEALDEDGVMSQFLMKMEASTDEKVLARAGLIRSALGVTAVRPPWYGQQVRLGLSAAEMAALGLLPLAVDDSGAPVAFGGGTIEVEGATPVAVDND